MRIAGTSVSVGHGAYEIYLSGCRAPHCLGCHNPELWDFAQGRPYEVMRRRLLERVASLPTFLDRIWILGGEPLDQDPQELEVLLADINGCRDVRSLWLFTRYENVPEWIWRYVEYVKIGAYEQNKTAGGPFISRGIPLASSNQRILTKDQYRRK